MSNLNRVTIFKNGIKMEHKKQNITKSEVKRAFFRWKNGYGYNLYNWVLVPIEPPNRFFIYHRTVRKGCIVDMWFVDNKPHYKFSDILQAKDVLKGYGLEVVDY